MNFRTRMNLHNAIMGLDIYRKFDVDHQIISKKEILTIIEDVLKTYGKEMNVNDYNELMNDIVIFPETIFLSIKYLR